MGDGLMLIIGEDGVARKYDDTYDITIHCETAEEQDQVRRMLTRQWVPVTEALPDEEGQYLVTWEGYVLILQYGKPLLPMNGPKQRKPDWYEITDDGDYYRECVTAWMSLPKPFEEGTKQ